MKLIIDNMQDTSKEGLNRLKSLFNDYNATLNIYPHEATGNGFSSWFSMRSEPVVYSIDTKSIDYGSIRHLIEESYYGSSQPIYGDINYNMFRFLTELKEILGKYGFEFLIFHKEPYTSYLPDEHVYLKILLPSGEILNHHSTDFCGEALNVAQLNALLKLRSCN